LLRDIAIRRSRKAAVLVRIERCGLCHSDLDIRTATPISARQSSIPARMTCRSAGTRDPGVVEEVGVDVRRLIGARSVFRDRRGMPRLPQRRTKISAPSNASRVAIDGGSPPCAGAGFQNLLDYDPLPAISGHLMCPASPAYGALKRLVDRPRNSGNLLMIGLAASA